MIRQKQPLFFGFPLSLPFLAVLAVPVITTAQVKTADAITLKNGSIIKGYIREMNDSSRVSIETLCENLWVFNMNEVASIDHDVPLSFRYPDDRSYPAGPAGFVNITEPGLLFGSGNNEKNSIFSILMTNGYGFRNNVTAGLGLGLEFFEQTQLPVFIDLRWILTDRSIAPVLMLKGGYSFMLEDPRDNDWYDYTGMGGFLWATGLGVQFRLNPHNILSVGMLYRYQNSTVSHTDVWYGDEIRVTKVYNRLAFRIGIAFD